MPNSSLLSTTNNNYSTNISTVGIDINEWIYDKSKQKQLTAIFQNSQQMQQQSIYLYQIDYTTNTKAIGPITFRTWDFAGQREYYSTHQVNIYICDKLIFIFLLNLVYFQVLYFKKSTLYCLLEVN